MTDSIKKDEKIVRNWLRWPSILFCMGVGCTGLTVLYSALYGNNSVDIGKLDTNFFLFFGGIFTLFGLTAGITTFVTGTVFAMYSNFTLKELDEYKEFSNGLLVVLKGHPKLIQYKHKEIVKRGYIRVCSTYNREKKLIKWYFMTD